MPQSLKLEQRMHSVMTFVASYNDYVVILLNAEMLLLSYLSHADAEIERSKGTAEGIKNYLLSEEMLM